MKRSKILTLLLGVILSTVSCNDNEKNAKLRFVTEARCHITPIKNQGKSTSCWIYGMLATIESNRIAIGDSVHLSAVYFERKALEDEGKLKLSQRYNGDVRIRGMMPHLMTMLAKHGAFTYDSYRRKDDGTLGIVPLHQFLYGADYTPQEFGRSVAMPEDYEFLGADYPFPDRRKTDRIKQTSPEEMLRLTEESVRKGFAVCWEGDISEKGFDWKNGVADMPYDKERYWRDIERSKTTDDHCMEICGITHDDNGQKYFICKNSWGKTNRFKGVIMMSYNYFLAKTILVSCYKYQEKEP